MIPYAPKLLISKYLHNFPDYTAGPHFNTF